jgi:hypothetical protein
LGIHKSIIINLNKGILNMGHCKSVIYNDIKLGFIFFGNYLNNII